MKKKKNNKQTSNVLFHYFFLLFHDTGFDSDHDRLSYPALGKCDIVTTFFPLYYVFRWMCLIILFLPFQRLKAFVVFQLFVEKLSGEAKHKFFRYLAPHILHSFIYSKVLNSMEPVNNLTWSHFQAHNENQSACRGTKCRSDKHQKSSWAIKQGQMQVLFDDSELEVTLVT